MSDDITMPEELKGNVFITKLSQVYGWGRRYSLWPLSFGLACCVFEFFATAAARWDFGRWGMDLARASPRHERIHHRVPQPTGASKRALMYTLPGIHGCREIRTARPPAPPLARVPYLPGRPPLW